jgi:hypothetical protein
MLRGLAFGGLAGENDLITDQVLLYRHHTESPSRPPATRAGSPARFERLPFSPWPLAWPRVDAWPPRGPRACRGRHTRAGAASWMWGRVRRVPSRSAGRRLAALRRRDTAITATTTTGQRRRVHREGLNLCVCRGRSKDGLRHFKSTRENISLPGNANLCEKPFQGPQCQYSRLAHARCSFLRSSSYVRFLVIGAMGHASVRALTQGTGQ